MSRYIQRILFCLAILWLSACQTGPGVLEVEIQPEASVVPDAEVVAEIRPAVNAILSGNVNQRKALIEYLRTPCTKQTGALGGPPSCAENEEEGTIVEVFPILESEGHYLRPHEIEAGLQFGVKRLYAVYREIVNPEAMPYWTSGGYALIFDRDENDFPLPVTVLVREGKIVRIQHHTGITAEDLLRTIPVSDVVLPPSQAQALNPTARVTEPPSDPVAIDFSVIPAPLEWPTYRNEDLGYQIQYMPEWIIEEHGLSQRTKEVIFNPPYPEDFKVALSVALDERPLDVIRQLYAEIQPEALASEVELAGEEATLYMYPWGRVEVYVPHDGRVYVLSTDYGDQTEYLQPLASFRFIER